MTGAPAAAEPTRAGRTVARAAALVCVAGATGFAVWACHAALRDHQVVLMADDWRIIEGFYQLPFWEWVFSNQNGHRIPLTLLLFAADWRWFEGRMVLLALGSLALAWLAVAALALGYRGERGFDTPLAWATFAFAGFAIFWAETMANFLCNVCNANLVATLFFLLSVSSFALYAHGQRAQPARSSHGLLLASLLAAALATFSMGQGVGSWAALLAIALAARVRLAVLACVVVAAATCVAVYSTGLEAHTSSGAPFDPKVVLFTAPGALLRFVAAFVGMVVARTIDQPDLVASHTEPLSFAIGACGLAFLAGHAAWICWRPRRAHPQDLLAIGIMSFSAAVGLGVGLTRLGIFGPKQAVAVRFLDWSTLFWVGAVLALPAIARRVARPWFSAAAAAVLVALVAAMLTTLEQQRVPRLQRQDRASRIALALILDARVPDVGKLSWGLQGPRIRGIAKQIKQQGRNVFAGIAAELPGSSLPDRFEQAPFDRCAGGVQTPRLVQAGRRHLSVSGWAWDVERGTGPALVVIVDASGIVRGLAHPESEGARLASRRAGTERVRWTGYLPRHDPGEWYFVHAILGDLQTSCFLGVLPPAAGTTDASGS